MRIFLASSDEMLRLALLLYLNNEPGMAVVGMADRSEGLIIQVEASNSELLLLDHELTREATAGLISDLNNLECPPRIIVLSLNPGMEGAIMEAGANGFVSKKFTAG